MRFLILFIPLFTAVASAAPGADEAVCNLRLKQGVQAGAPGTAFMRDFAQYGEKTVYMGRYGGVHYGFEGHGGDIRLVKLSDETVAKFGLQPGTHDYPAIPKQMSPTMCVPTAVGYLQDISLPNGSPLRAIPAPARAVALTGLSSPFFAWAGFFQNPMNPQAGAAEAQDRTVRETLKASGLQVQETDSPDEIMKALSEGKKVFLGVIASESNQWVKTDSKHNPYIVVRTLQPYYGGDAGHAMVAMDLFHADDGSPVVVLMDPFSGLPVPTDVYYLQPSAKDSRRVAIQNAYVVGK